jgi:hypothetical protein
VRVFAQCNRLRYYLGVFAVAHIGRPMQVMVKLSPAPLRAFVACCVGFPT